MKIQNALHGRSQKGSRRLGMAAACPCLGLLFLALAPGAAMAECSFDSMALLGNGKVYVTKGDEYIRYSGADATEIDEGYPQRITGGNWGDLPRGFRSGFDAMSLFGNDRVYVTRGDRYIRYADAEADEVDEGFPKSLTGGNWGGEEFIAWACSTHD